MKKTLCLLTLIICFLTTVRAGQDPQTLIPSKTIEREIAGGESHTFQISLRGAVRTLPFRAAGD